MKKVGSVIHHPFSINASQMVLYALLTVTTKPIGW